MTPFEQILDGKCLTGIVRAGMPPESYGDFSPPLVPVNFLGEYTMVNPDKPWEVDHDRLKATIEERESDWLGDLLVLNLEKLFDPDSPSESQLRGRKSSCLKQPQEWTEAALQAALADAKVQVRRTADVLNAVTKTVRAQVPHMRLAHWGTCPHIHPRDTYSGPTANRVAECKPHDAEPQQWFYQRYLWLVEHMRLQAELIAPTLDWYGPGVYLGDYHGWMARSPGLSSFRDDVTGEITPLHAATRSEWDVWSLSILTGLRIAESVLPDKPMLPFVALQWWQLQDKSWSHGWGKQLVGPKLIVDMLDFVRTAMQRRGGEVLWCQHRSFNEDPNKFYKSRTFRAARGWAARRMCMQTELDE